MRPLFLRSMHDHCKMIIAPLRCSTCNNVMEELCYTTTRMSLFFDNASVLERQSHLNGSMLFVPPGCKHLASVLTKECRISQPSYFLADLPG